MKNHIDVTFERQKLLSEIALQLSEINDFKGKSQQLIDTIAPLSMSESIHTYRWDESTNRYIIVSSWYLNEQYRNECSLYCHSISRDDIPDTLYEALYNGKAQFCDKKILPVTQIDWVNKSLIYGFTALDKLQGILVYSTSNSEGWDDFSIQWLHTIASMVSSAIRRSFLYDKLQQELALRDKVYPIIAHDLRSGVGTIKMLTQGAQMAESIDELREVNRMIARSADDTFMLLDNLLKWSRGRMQTNHLATENIEIVSLLHNVAEAFQMTAATKGIKLEFICNLARYTIEADEEMIRTVTRNLISNALKFTPSGGSIKVECQVSKKVVEVSVTDSGVGMSQETLQKLVEGSEHVTTYGTSGEKGVGMGLSLVRDFLKLHNSSLRIESQLGVGTTMSFVL